RRVWTIIEAPRQGGLTAATIGGFAGALVILAGFAWWQLRRRDPLLDVRLFRNPRFSAASGAIALAFFGLFGFIFLITQYFQVVRGYDPLRAGLATVPFAIVTGAMSPAAIGLMKPVGTKIIVTAGPLLMSSRFVGAPGGRPAVGRRGPRGRRSPPARPAGGRGGRHPAGVHRRPARRLLRRGRRDRGRRPGHAGV